MTDLHIFQKGRLCSLNFNKIIIAFLWLLGLLFGCQIAHTFSGDVLVLFQSIAYSKITVLGYIAVLFAPYFLTIFFVLIRKRFLAYSVIFFKGFLFSLCASGLSTSFGNAGWLVSRLFMFADACGVLVLIWMWLRLLSEKKEITAVLCVAFLGLTAVALMDAYLISPFVNFVFNY